MEEMRVDMPQNGPGQYGSDRELFQRVWNRVVPEGTQSPIRMEPPPISQQGLVPVPVREEVPVDCLGEGSSMDVPQLEELARQVVRDGRVYQGLARRVGGAAARVLSGMAADERRNAKKLAAAYFLITGQRWQGASAEGEQRQGQEPMHMLRHQYMAEQRTAAMAQAAAQQTDDLCLRQMYMELAREKQTHARAIRSLLEQM